MVVQIAMGAAGTTPIGVKSPVRISEIVARKRTQKNSRRQSVTISSAPDCGVIAWACAY